MRIPSARKLKLHDFSFDDCTLDDDGTLKVSAGIPHDDSLFDMLNGIIQTHDDCVSGMFTHVSGPGLH